MKFKLNYFIKSTLLLSVLTLAVLLLPNTSVAAQSEKEQDGITKLDKNTVYEYDLNGDGTTEKVLYKVTTDDEEYNVTLKLYINDKLNLTRTGHGFDYTLELCDLDKNDDYLNLYGYSTMESDCINDSFFAKYNGNKIVDVIKFQPSKTSKIFTSIRYSISTVDGDGKFTVIVDTPIYSNAIGCYYCSIPFQLKDNKISMVSVKTYSLNKYSKEYLYKTQKSFSVYSKVGSKKVVFKVKKGEKVTFDKLYMSKSGKAYFRIINSKGAKGWIKSDQEGLFSNMPAWG